MSTSLSAMRTNVRYLIDESSADRWSDTEIDSYINKGAAFLQSKIHRMNQEWFLRVETFTAAAASYQAAVPSDIWGGGIRSLQFYENSTVASGEPRQVSKGQLEWVYQNQHYSGAPENYAELAGYLLWAPLLQYASTFRFVYAKKEPTLTNDTDVLDRIKDEHTDIIENYAAKLAVQKIGGDTRPFDEAINHRLMELGDDITPVDPIIIPQTAID